MTSSHLEPEVTIEITTKELSKVLSERIEFLEEACNRFASTLVHEKNL